MTTPMISCCSKSAAPWPNMNGPSLPTGCAAAAKPKSGADSCYPGPCPPMGTCWTRNARGTPAVCGSIPSKRRWSPKSLPGIPSRRRPARSMASPNGSVTPSCRRPRANRGGMPPACGGSCAIAVYTGMAHSGKSRPVPARQRKSALRPVGPGVSHRPTPPEDWVPIPCACHH